MAQEAFRIGALVEEVDIQDLYESLLGGGGRTASEYLCQKL